MFFFSICVATTHYACIRVPWGTGLGTFTSQFFTKLVLLEEVWWCDSHLSVTPGNGLTAGPLVACLAALDLNLNSSKAGENSSGKVLEALIR